MKAISATSKAVPAASAPNRRVAAGDLAQGRADSSEMAEVTVMTVWRELQKSQKTNPPNRHA